MRMCIKVYCSQYYLRILLLSSSRLRGWEPRAFQMRIKSFSIEGPPKLSSYIKYQLARKTKMKERKKEKKKRNKICSVAQAGIKNIISRWYATPFFIHSCFVSISPGTLYTLLLYSIYYYCNINNALELMLHIYSFTDTYIFK